MTFLGKSCGVFLNPFYRGRTQQKGSICESENVPSTDITFAGTLILCQLPEIKKQIAAVYTLHSLWGFAIVTQTSKVT